MLDIVKKRIKSGIISRPYIKNLDEIPPPSRHLMQMDFYLCTKDRLPDTYLYFVPPHTKTASILTSRGCPYSCTFCHNSWRGIPCRYNSAERVVSEIKQLIEVYDIEALFFIEDNLFANKPRLKKICKMMKEEKFDIIWGGNARADNVDLNILQMAKEAGCRQVTFGFESGSQKILNVLNKKTTVQQNRLAIKLCKQVGLLVNGTFMIGNPTETIEDIRATQQFIKENDIDCAGVCITTPYPGTEIWKWCEKRGLIPKSFNWSDFTYDKVSIPACDTIPPEEIQRLWRETIDQVFINNVLKHPIGTVIKAISSPSKILKFVRRRFKNSEKTRPGGRK
jgi:magnesium-protoporphyrin IX monomethyl ester (oxidative) cyclase